MSWKGQVKTGYDTSWASNALRFATENEAIAHVRELETRWLSVTATRTVEVEDAVNSVWNFRTGKVEEAKDGT